MAENIKKWTSKRVRETFIEYFVNKDHRFWPSSSVLPHNDSTLLFTNAGMNQFKPVILGTLSPKSPLHSLKTAVNAQKCIRAGGKHNDLEDAGKDTYHHTFFEMLGNWSFGEYSKEKAIDLAWNLLTKVYKLDENRLYVTYFNGNKSLNLSKDTETQQIWLKYVPQSRVLPFGRKDNFWEMGETGPCGPCTEIHYDSVGNRDASSLVNKDSPEVVELWNLVFIQFNRSLVKDIFNLETLPKMHVDTGMGFERLTAILQGVKSNYDTDIFAPLFEALRTITKCEFPYKGQIGTSPDADRDTAYRVSVDHARTLCVAMADGAVPDSVGQGYVLRRILRRAVRTGKILFENNQIQPFLNELVPVVADMFKNVYHNIHENREEIQKMILSEEQNFLSTLNKGETHLSKIIHKLNKKGIKCIPGTDAFFLYSSFGFPVDLTAQAAREKGLEVDIKGFEIAKEKDRQLSKNAKSTAMCNECKSLNLSLNELESLYKANLSLTHTEDVYGPDEFIKAIILAIKFEDSSIIIEKCEQKNFNKGSVILITDKTNFYAESGGQVSDTGFAKSVEGEGVMKIMNTQNSGGFVLHIGEMVKGSFSPRETVQLEADFERRNLIRANHTMTHVLNHSLRTVCGLGLEQKGSKVSPNKFTFDFNSNALENSSIVQIEKLSNDIIKSDLKVFSKVVQLKEAQSLNGIRAVFGETYPDPVRVVSIGISIEDANKKKTDKTLREYSIELCGGTHLKSTGGARAFCIVSESGIAKGIRRIVALTGPKAIETIENSEKQLSLYKNAMNLDSDKLTTFLKESQNDGNNKNSLCFAVAKEIEKLKTSLKKSLHKKSKKCNSQIESNLYETLSSVISPSNTTQSDSKDKKQYKLSTSENQETVVVYLQEKIDPKIMKKVTNRLKKNALKQRNVMLISLVNDKKNELKGQVICFVPKSKTTNSPNAKEWIEFLVNRVGGKGHGNQEISQGQCEYIPPENSMKILEKVRDFMLPK